MVGGSSTALRSGFEGPISTGFTRGYYLVGSLRDPAVGNDTVSA